MLALILACAATSALRAAVEVEPAAVDFGRQRQNLELMRDVVLVNHGAEPVALLGVSTDCSCSTGELQPGLLEPGAQKTLSVRFATRMYQGEIKRRLLVHTSGGDVVVPISVVVSPYENWTVSPLPVVLMPSLRTQTASGSFTLTYTGPEEVEAATARASLSWLTAAIAPGAAAKTFVVSLHKSADAPVGNLAVTVTIETTDPKSPSLAVAVVVPVASSARLVPNPVVMPVTSPGVATRAAFRIIGWTGRTPPDVRLPRGTVTSLGQLNGEYTFEIAFTPEQAGTIAQMVQIYEGAVLQFEAQVVARVVAEQP